jgi:hypothetical protein
MNGHQFSLGPFPSAEPLPAATLTGMIARAGDSLSLRYELQGAFENISLPPPVNRPARRRGLWEGTCFELFLGLKDSPAYWEFNLSPAGDWNVYRFDDYREGMQEEAGLVSLPFSIRRGPGALQLALEVDLSRIIPPGQAVEAGISAVIRLRDGRRTYWALAHCAQKPDFHRRNSFILTL